MTSAQLETVEISRRGNDAVICVPRRCKFTRLIVSLSRNNAQWLTSLGWRAEEKSIALKCDNTANGLEIYLSNKFSGEIEPSDIVSISCQELNFQGKMKWGGTRAPKASVSAVAVKDVPVPAKTSMPSMGAQSEKAGLSKKYIICGVSALVLLSAAAMSFRGGDKTPDAPIHMAKTERAGAAASEAKALRGGASLEKDNAVDTKSAKEQKRDAAKAVAAEIALKKDEAEEAAEQLIQNEKEAVAAKKQAEIDAAKKLKDDKLAAKKKAKAEKAALVADKTRKAKAKRAADKKAKDAAQAAKRIAVAKTPAPETPQVKIAPPELRLNRPALTAEEISKMQNSLGVMGYYSGPVDGNLSSTTISSAVVFRSIFDMPANGEIDRDFANEVKKQRKIYDARMPVSAPQPIADVVTDAPLKDVPVKRSAMPTQVPDELDVAQEVQSKPETPIKVERKILEQPAPAYPNRPADRDSFTEVVQVIVSYTVNSDGRPENLKIVENSHTGLFMKDFNKAVFKAAERNTYEPLSSSQPPDTETYLMTYTFKK